MVGVQGKGHNKLSACQKKKTPKLSSCYDLLTTNFSQVDDVLMEQRPADYGGMKTYLKKTYDRVEK